MYLGWTDERKELVIKLWNEGLTGTQIACKVGGVSRNAVLGLVHRKGLMGRRNQGADQRQVNRIRHNARARQEDKARIRASALSERRKIIKTRIESPVRALLRDLPTEPMPAVDTMPAQVSFNDLVAHHCRAIVAEHLPFDEHRKIYCGERKVLGQQYCPEHCRRYFQPPKVQAGANVPGKHFGGLIGRVISSEIGSMKTAEEFLEA